MAIYAYMIHAQVIVEAENKGQVSLIAAAFLNLFASLEFMQLASFFFKFAIDFH